MRLSATAGRGATNTTRCYPEDESCPQARSHPASVSQAPYLSAKSSPSQASSPSTVGISSETVGWMGTAR
jgi:hypothetical protein